MRVKDCPYCANQIQDAARKCQFCGEFLEDDAPAVLAAEDGDFTSARTSTGPEFIGLLRLYLLIGFIGFAVAAWTFFRQGHPLDAAVLAGGAVAFVLLAPAGWWVGDVVRRFAMPESYYVSGGIVALIKQRLFWMVGPQTVGVAVVAAALYFAHSLVPEAAGFGAQPLAETPAIADHVPPPSAEGSDPAPVELVASEAGAQTPAPASEPEIIAQAPTATPPPEAERAQTCGGGDNVAELVCSDPELSQADRQLLALYNQRLAVLGADDKTKLAEQQRAWLQDDRARCRDKKCMLRLYEFRTKQFQAP
jgi:uncharacterized protein YecT (DUF1311 family)